MPVMRATSSRRKPAASKPAPVEPREVRPGIWYVPPEQLDELANSEGTFFAEQIWVEVSHWGGRLGYERKRGSYWWGVLGVELRGLAGELMVVSDEWMERDRIVRAQEEAERQEKEIDSPWNVERAAKLARMPIAVFKELPSYERRHFLLEAWLNDMQKSDTHDSHAGR